MRFEQAPRCRRGHRSTFMKFRGYLKRAGDLRPFWSCPVCSKVVTR